MTASVRIELGWTWVIGQPEVKAGADIYITREAGRATFARKPDLTITGESNASLLAHISEWMRQNDDPGLSKMAAENKRQRKEPT